MDIETLVLGDFQSNCFMVRATSSASECVVVDIGFEGEAVLTFLQDRRWTPKAVILTHGHCDHVAGVQTLKTSFKDLKLYIHAEDAFMLKDAQANLSMFFGGALQIEDVCDCVQDQDVIDEASVPLTVLHTPGHTPGGMCLYNAEEKVVFTDDTLFAAGIGRSDFPGSDGARLMQSIQEKLLVLPEETIVYPGHGPTTTIGKEKASNPWLLQA